MDTVMGEIFINIHTDVLTFEKDILKSKFAAVENEQYALAANFDAQMQAIGTVKEILKANIEKKGKTDLSA